MIQDKQQSLRKERIKLLFVDDEELILELYEKTLKSFFSEEPRNSLSLLEEKLFGESSEKTQKYYPEIHTAKQAEAALEIFKTAKENNDPFSIVFLDVRMPPGRDGVWCGEQMRIIDPYVEIVIVTAYSDIPVQEIQARIYPPERLLFIVKPFHGHEIYQFVISLYEKWQSEKKIRSVNESLLKEIESLDSDFKVLNQQRSEILFENTKLNQELDTIEKKFSVIFEQLHEGIIITNTEGVITQVNLEAETIFDKPASSLIGVNFDELPFRYNKLPYQNGKEYYLQRTDGSRIEIEIDFKEINLNKTDNLRVYLIRDVTLRKSFEKKLIMHSYVFSNSDSAIIFSKPDGTVYDCNPAFTKVYGYSYDEAIGKKMSFVNPEGEKITKTILDSLEQKGTWEGFLEIVRKDGSTGWTKTYVSHMKDYSGSIIGIMGINLDVTSEINAVNARVKAEKTVERSLRLASLGSLAGGISHEINQPLMSIKTDVDGFLMWNEKNNSLCSTDEMLEIFRSVSQNVARINEIISTIRHLINFEFASPEKYEDINHLVDLYINEYRKKPINSDILFTLRQAQLPLFKINRLILRQIFDNLINNAITQLRNSGNSLKEIIVKTSFLNNSMVINVSDNGPGIAPEILPVIFDPFITTKTDNKNMGLGLTITEQYVRSLNGSIYAENLENGASFTVTIPLNGVNDENSSS
ncbi:MAG: PAS domain S-box protein [Candidatus Cloacimonetes bacterium]|nr:PAS domain S-box protein [Candidatus Cloacimonadota bacterium]